MRKLSLAPDRLRYAWIGHPAGRDFVLAALGASLSRDGLALNAGASYLCQGEHGLFWDWSSGRPANEERTPTGLPSHGFFVDAGVDWQALPRLRLRAAVLAGHVLNAGHVSGEREAGAGLSLTAEYAL